MAKGPLPTALPPLPPLAAVRCFEAAARHLSFTRAADELAMTQAAVSYQIKVLEERLGVPLFLRGPRGVSLSEAGRRLEPAVTSAFADLREAFAAIGGERGGTLTLSVVNSFAAHWLLPRLGGFGRAHPEIAVRLEVSPELVDFARRDVDVAIRMGQGDWPGLARHRIMDVAFTPILSAELLAASRPLRTPADLLDLPLIDPVDPWWGQWFAAAGVEAPALAARRGLWVESQTLAARAALSDQGVAILSPEFFADELARGALVQPFPLLHAPGSAYYLVYPPARRRAPRVAAFREWVLREAAETPAVQAVVGAPPDWSPAAALSSDAAAPDRPSSDPSAADPPASKPPV
ncbi:transcriptional regulator GcvA [Pseudoxanthobacter sp. M-2]|uniref:transcriptional regulator GcvA n=1 Tax=Pseudoxanthobacter sp. M-2 TaxID=3078754 RepID=UPI0038FC7ED9